MRLLTWVLSVATVLALAAGPAGAAPVFTLDPPGGALFGVPGQVLGWGLTIRNDGAGGLVITSATYDQSVSIGDFTDFITPQFLLYVLPPNGVWTQALNASASEGLGSYVIDGSFALPGDVAVGFLDLLYEIRSIDGEGNPRVDSYQVLLPASVTYVPEPATTAATLAGLALLGLVKAARRRS